MNRLFRFQCWSSLRVKSTFFWGDMRLLQRNMIKRMMSMPSTHVAWQIRADTFNHCMVRFMPGTEITVQSSASNLLCVHVRVCVRALSGQSHCSARQSYPTLFLMIYSRIFGLCWQYDNKFDLHNIKYHFKLQLCFNSAVHYCRNPSIINNIKIAKMHVLSFLW